MEDGSNGPDDGGRMTAEMEEGRGKREATTLHPTPFDQIKDGRKGPEDR
jgi:hypothetical protein